MDVFVCMCVCVSVCLCGLIKDLTHVYIIPASLFFFFEVDITHRSGKAIRILGTDYVNTSKYVRGYLCIKIWPRRPDSTFAALAVYWNKDETDVVRLHSAVSFGTANIHGSALAGFQVQYAGQALPQVTKANITRIAPAAPASPPAGAAADAVLAAAVAPAVVAVGGAAPRAFIRIPHADLLSCRLPACACRANRLGGRPGRSADCSGPPPALWKMMCVAGWVALSAGLVATIV